MINNAERGAACQPAEGEPGTIPVALFLARLKGNRDGKC